jgi:HD-like signal output (HDOD) protein/ActR/RegA family two-component response regulator
MVDRKRILFVDDERNILQGLQDLLRKQRKDWDMAFALGSQAALDELARAPFDVIVSDMRMPGMDGAELLARVKDQYPSVARIVLSGHADRDAIVRALPVAHQYLSKPCSAETLRSTIERVWNLHALLADPITRQLVGKMDKIPSPPAIYWELTRAAAAPDVGLADLGKIVEKDPAMSAKVLQLVNSSYFGIAQTVTSVPRAVTYLGLELLKVLAISAHVFGAVTMPAIEGFSLEELQNDSLVVAQLARRFLNNSKKADDVFGASIVHDVGRIVLALGLPERYQRVIRAAAESHRAVHLVEAEELGVTHAEVGAYLLGIWGLPLNLVETAAFHHVPSQFSEGPLEILAAFHAADALVDAGRHTMVDAALDVEFLERAGMLGELPRWRALADDMLRTDNA